MSYINSPLRCAGCAPLDVIDCGAGHYCNPGEQGYTCGKVSAKRFVRYLAIQCRRRCECHILMTAESCYPKNIVRSLFLRWQPLFQAYTSRPRNARPSVVKQPMLSEPASCFSPAKSDAVVGYCLLGICLCFVSPIIPRESQKLLQWQTCPLEA